MKENFSLNEIIIKLFRNKIFVFLVFLLLPYLFFAYRVNIFQVAIAPGDGIIQGIPTKVFSSWAQLWNPYVQTGTYPFKDIGWQALYLPGILLMRLFPNALGYNLLLLAHYSVAGFFTYLFLEKLNLHRTAALIGGFTFMFCGFFTAHKGHHTMLMAASYLPIILYYFQCYASSKKTYYLLITGIMFGMSILADYTAVPMYIGMVLFPYMVCTFLFEREFAPAALNESKKFSRSLLHSLYLIVRSSLLVFGVGLLIAAVQLLPIVESLQYVTRQSVSYDFFASYSFRLSLLPLLIFPYFFGGTSTLLKTGIRYFGPWNLTELTGYMGILPIFFAGTGLLLFWKKSWRVVFWAAAALVAAVLVIGDSTPLYRIMYHIPIYNMFRVPARNWLEVNFAVAVLGGYFVSYMIDSTSVEIKKYIKIIVPALVAFLLGVFFLLSYGYRLWGEERMSTLIYKNTRLSSPAVYIPLFVILISAMLLLAIYFFKQKRQLWSVIGLFIILDLFSFGNFHDTEYPNFGIFQNKMTDVAMFLEKENPDKASYRILPLWPYKLKSSESQLYPLINMLYKYNTVNGYGAIWLKDYRDLTKFTVDGVSVLQETLLRNSTILSLLSTKYILISNPAQKDFVNRLMVGDESSKPTQLVINGFSANKEYAVGAEFSEESVVLKSDGSGRLSLVQIPFQIEPNANYKVMFSARTPGDYDSKGALIVDFYGKNYDRGQQENNYDKARLTEDFQEYYSFFNSGPETPETAFLRFFTFSDVAFEVKDIKVMKLSNNVDYWGGETIKSLSPLYPLRYESPEGVAVYENVNFLPRARFVPDVQEVENTTAAIETLWGDLELNPAKTALIEGYTGDRHFESGEVLQADYSRSEVIDLQVKTSGRSFLVLSDTYYVGWKAYVDGIETPIYKTNGTSRGIIVDGAGEHLVKFLFVPMSFYIGLAVSLLTLLIVIFFAIRLRR